MIVSRSGGRGGLYEQRQKARQPARRAGQRQQLAGFVKIVRDVRYVRPLDRRGLRQRWRADRTASGFLQYAGQRERNVPERALALAGIAYITHPIPTG